MSRSSVIPLSRSQVCFSFHGWKEAVPALFRMLAPCRHTCVSVRPLTHVQPPQPQRGILCTVGLPGATLGIQTSWGSVCFNPRTLPLSLLERLEHSWGLQPKGVCWFILAHTVDVKMIVSFQVILFCVCMCVCVYVWMHLLSLHFFQLPRWILISPLNPQHLVLILSWGCFSKQFSSPGKFSFLTICCTATNRKNSLKSTNKNRFVVF